MIQKYINMLETIKSLKYLYDLFPWPLHFYEKDNRVIFKERKFLPIKMINYRVLEVIFFHPPLCPLREHFVENLFTEYK